MRKLLAILLVFSLATISAAVSEEIDVVEEPALSMDSFSIEVEDDQPESIPGDATELDLSEELLIGEDRIEDVDFNHISSNNNDTDISVGPDSDPESIRYIQEMLVAVRALSEGNVNGVYDSATSAAVKAFQQWINEQRNELTLEVTGLVDDLTRLYLEYAYDHDMVITEDVGITEVNFPDAIFRAYVMENCDKDGNGYLSNEEMESVREMDISDLGIETLTGIEYFTMLEELDCSYNKLISLDVSANTRLIDLDCRYNRIDTIITGQNTSMDFLCCMYNNLRTLDLTGIPNIKYLYCIDNLLKQLDFSVNGELIKEIREYGPYFYPSEGYISFIHPESVASEEPRIYFDRSVKVYANGELLYGPDKVIKRKAKAVAMGVGEKDSSILCYKGLESCNYYTPLWITNSMHGDITYKTSNSKVVAVNNKKGYVKAVRQGKATVTVKSSLGVEVTCKVTVKKAPSRITLSKKKMQLKLYDDAVLKAKLPSGSTCRELRWSSSDEDIVSVGDFGNIDAQAPGTATITVKTYNGKKATCKVTVKAPEPTTLSLNTAGLHLGIGETFQIIPTIDEGTSTTFSYKSKNKKIASVSSKGLVKGKKKGTTKITVKTKNGLAKSFEVQVGKTNIYKSGTSGVRVYASLSDKYFHINTNCVEIKGNPSRITLETALNYGKQPCAECAASARRTVYIGKGKYYHYKKSHAGTGAKKCMLAEALASGYVACPDCVVVQ